MNVLTLRNFLPLLMPILLFVPGARGEDIRVREDADALLKPANRGKLDALKLAFKTLQDSTDTRKNLRFWANIHDAPFGELTTGPCEHQNETIWPWHRAYLYEFETALRLSHPPETSNVTLPYWNWTAPPSGKRYPKIFEETGSPLNYTNRDAATHPSAPVRSTGEVDLLNIPIWKDFGGGLRGSGEKGEMESCYHDVVHGFIGGDNSNTQKAARDPIFWAHHANLDRIWLAWQAKYGVNPVGQTDPIRGFPSMKVQDWNDVSMKYSYGPKETLQSPLRMRLFTSELKIGQKVPCATFDVKISCPAEGERLVLQLTDVRHTGRVGGFFTGTVYLHPKGEALDAKYLLTEYGQWDSSHTRKEGAGMHASSLKLLFDVTARAREILTQTGDRPMQVSLEFLGNVSPEGVDQLRASANDGVQVGKVDFVTRTIPALKKPSDK